MLLQVDKRAGHSLDAMLQVAVLNQRLARPVALIYEPKVVRWVETRTALGNQPHLEYLYREQCFRNSAINRSNCWRRGAMSAMKSSHS